MRHLTRLAPADALMVTVGVDEVIGLLNEGEVVGTDVTGQEVQTMGTSIRVVEADLSERPAVGTSVTIRRTDRTREMYRVRQVLRDGANQGFLWLLLART